MPDFAALTFTEPWNRPSFLCLAFGEDAAQVTGSVRPGGSSKVLTRLKAAETK